MNSQFVTIRAQKNAGQNNAEQENNGRNRRSRQHRTGTMTDMITTKDWKWWTRRQRTKTLLRLKLHNLDLIQICFRFVIQLVSPPLLPRRSRQRRVYVLPLFLIFVYFFIFDDFCQTNYLNIYPTDRRLMFKVGSTTAADKRSEVGFSIPRGKFPWQPILWALSTEFSSSHTIKFLSFSDIRQTTVSIREK